MNLTSTQPRTHSYDQGLAETQLFAAITGAAPEQYGHPAASARRPEPSRGEVSTGGEMERRMAEFERHMEYVISQLSSMQADLRHRVTTEAAIDLR